MIDFMHELKDAGRDAWVVQHIQAPGEAEQLVAEGREIFGTDPLFVSEVGPVIGAHVGPGLLGVGGIPPAMLA
jgi:fatty acid-binding protein DegV